MLQNDIKTTVAIIGAGPSGSVAASLLIQKGYSVVILERALFPRFSIGESLLPQSMKYLEEAGMLDVIKKEDSFQLKNGAAFSNNTDSSTIEFADKFTAGFGYTYQVRRDKFDKILADNCEEMGVEIYYETSVVAVNNLNNCIELVAKNLKNNKEYSVKADFVLDASGFGRVLPRILKLESPSDMPIRQSLFCHVNDNITDESFDRNKILISVHPTDKNIWYWLIPFADGVSSIGVVAEPHILSKYGNNNKQALEKVVAEMPYLNKLLLDSTKINDVQKITGYSASVSKLYGGRYALLGNAAEFLDPVFSSGVTIALKSASLAVSVLDKHLKGQKVDWDKEFVKPLYVGIDTFRVFVNAWYDGSLQDVIFNQNSNSKIKSMIASVLAGYAWDEENPFVSDSNKKLSALASLCRK